MIDACFVRNEPRKENADYEIRGQGNALGTLTVDLMCYLIKEMCHFMFAI